MKAGLILFIIVLVGCGPLPRFDRAGDGNVSDNSNSSERLTLTFLDVGQGDATVISSQDEVMLIDAGPKGAGKEAVLPFLKEQKIEKIKYIVATHYHDDHIGGIPEVIKGEDQVLGTADDRIPTDGILDRGGDYERYSPAYEEYKDVTAGIRRALSPGEHIALGAASIDVLAQNGQVSDGTKIELEPFDENSASVVLLMTSGDFRYLHESDLTGGGGDPPYETIDIETSLAPLAGDIDVLRVAHHGSKTSTNEVFLDTVAPEVAIISVGIGNDFGHPHDEVIDRLSDAGVDVYLTEDGPVTVSVSDDGWSIE
jgi:competence protein ComEC